MCGCGCVCEGQADAEEALPLPEGMSLPLKSDSEVESFDATLEQDVGLRKALVRVIAFFIFTLWCYDRMTS